MYFVNSYFTVAIYLSAIVGVVYAILHWRKSIVADSRMQRMMLSCGIDEETVLSADQRLKLDMAVVRSRCRNCATTDLCDRWLGGEPMESAGFCPNNRHFTTAAHSS